MPRHRLCHEIQSDPRLWPYVIPAKISPLAPAWLPDVRAVVSSFVVGILAQESLATIRKQLIPRCPEFREAFGHGYDFQKLVEGVEAFLRSHPDVRERIRA